MISFSGDYASDRGLEAVEREVFFFFEGDPHVEFIGLEASTEGPSHDDLIFLARSPTSEGERLVIRTPIPRQTLEHEEATTVVRDFAPRWRRMIYDALAAELAK